MIKYKLNHAWLVFIVLITTCCSPIFSSEIIKDRIDSMFVIASSGDFKYREMVAPTIDDIAALGVEAVPFLIDRLGTTDARERVTLENILKKIGSPVVPLLNQALLETDSLQLSRVAKILYYLPDSSSVANLLKVKNNRYYWVRYQSIRALGKIGDLRAGPAIVAALRDENELVRTMAAVAAGRIDDPGLLPHLLQALNDDYYGVRMAARDEFIKINCAGKSKFLSHSLTTERMSVVKNILHIIANDSCLYDYESIKPFLQDRDPVIVGLAIRAGFRVAPGSLMEHLRLYPPTSESLFVTRIYDEIMTNYETRSPQKP